MGHVVVGLMKQELNWAVVGLLAMNLIAQYIFYIAVFSAAHDVRMFVIIGFFGIVQSFAIFLSFGGWLISGMFRPLDAS